MVLAKNQWLNDSENEQKSVYTATTTPIIKNTTVTGSASAISTQPAARIIRTMASTIANAENDLLVPTSSSEITSNMILTTPLAETLICDLPITKVISNPPITPATDVVDTTITTPILDDHTKAAISQENEQETNICDTTDMLLLVDRNDKDGNEFIHEYFDEREAASGNLTVINNETMSTVNTNSEMKEQFNNSKISNNHNKNENNNIEESNLECDDINTNTLQNNASYTFDTKLSICNNWCTMTEQSGTKQTTDRCKNVLGVDLSSINKALNLPQQQTAKHLQYINDDTLCLSTKSVLTKTAHPPTTTLTSISSAAIALNLKGSNNVDNSNFNLSNNCTANNILDVENGQAKILLLCESNSHPFQARTIILTPNIECKVGRLIAKSKASESNAIFDCKVLSRNHAVIWFTSEDQKFWVKDTKSSNGTFINDQKLGNEAAELHFGDIVKFGVDVVENSRKEVHGCIIASVKLYLPDGREAISIESSSNEKYITYDELHRLNLYVQEVSNREKNLKSKLFNIQNILDATRKNSGLCWQALIAEDQLLHRIHMLEKKLQVMEKNIPESSLRNEVSLKKIGMYIKKGVDKV